MANDAELDRLKTAQDRAFQNKQSAFSAQDSSWKHVDSARKELNRAFEAKQRAYSDLDGAWERYQSIKNSNGSRIDSLNSLQESAHQNMLHAFDSASSAYNRRDGAGAASYAADGRRYKAERDGYVAERRRLIDEIRSSRVPHDNAKPVFQRAKEEFSSAKRKFDSAQSEHDRAKQAFQKAKAEFDTARTAFQKRLEFLKSEKKLHNEKDRRLAEQAGVPFQYLNNLRVKPAPDGGMNFYFGGLGEPDGPGHGHYATDGRGVVTYKREPFDPHGSQNFTNDPRWQRFDGGFGESITFEGKNAIRESGLDTQTGRPTINVYYGGSGGNPLGSGHGHVVYYQDNPNRIVHRRQPK